MPLRAHGIVSRRAPDADAPAEENWWSGWLGQVLRFRLPHQRTNPQDVQAIEPPRQPLVGPWQVPLGVGAYERARLELGGLLQLPPMESRRAPRGSSYAYLLAEMRVRSTGLYCVVTSKRPHADARPPSRGLCF